MSHLGDDCTGVPTRNSGGPVPRFLVVNASADNSVEHRSLLDISNNRTSDNRKETAAGTGDLYK